MEIVSYKSQVSYKYSFFFIFEFKLVAHNLLDLYYISDWRNVTNLKLEV